MANFERSSEVVHTEFDHCYGSDNSARKEKKASKK